MITPAFGSDTGLCCAGIACYVVALLIARLMLDAHLFRAEAVEKPPCDVPECQE